MNIQERIDAIQEQLNELRKQVTAPISKYKVGDIVKIVNIGETYTTYRSLFEELGFENKVENKCVDKDSIGTVFAVWYVKCNEKHLYAINISNEQKSQVLMGEYGITEATRR